MLDMDSIKRELRNDVKPRKVIRYALVPQVRGLANPLKDVFSILVKTVGLLFIQAKLIDADNLNAQGRGIGSIWAMIVDASARLEFKREKIPQLTVFYAVVGMIVLSFFGIFSLATKIFIGHAHAETSNSIFVDTGFANSWLNFLYPSISTGGGGGTASAIAQALGATLGIYNTGILCIASLFALWSIIAMLTDSAHHGKWGGQRHSALYAPIRLVFAIGLLTPLGAFNNFNAAQVLAVEIAHMGSGLGSTIWNTFVNSLSTLTAQNMFMPSGQVGPFVQKLILNGVCEEYYRKIYANGNDINPNVNWSGTPVYGPQSQSSGAPTQGSIVAYKVNFSLNQTANNGSGDDECGSLTVPAAVTPSSNGGAPTSQNAWGPIVSNYYTNTVVPIADGIVNNAEISQGGANPNPYPIDWSKDSSGILPQFQQAIDTEAGTLASTYMSGSNASSSFAATAQAEGWVSAGSMFLKLMQISSDIAKLQTRSFTANLPDDNILPTIAQFQGKDSIPQECSWYAFWCSNQTQHVKDGLVLGYQSLKVSQSFNSTAPDIFNTSAPSSDAAGTTGSNLWSILGLGNIVTFFTGTGGSGCPQWAQNTGCNAQNPANDFAQPIFAAVYFGKLMMVMDAGLFTAAMASGVEVLGESAGAGLGMVLTFFGAIFFPVALMFAVYLPLMPTIRFLFGILTWLLSIFESLLGLPVVALWHLRSEGEGLFAHGQQGYLLILQMMLRPGLMIFGLIGSIMVFDTLFNFISYTVFGTWANMGGEDVVSGLGDVLTFFAFLQVYAFLVFSIANLSFNLINTIPDRILSWIGSGIAIGTGQDDVMGASIGAVQGAQKAQKAIGTGIGNQTWKGIQAMNGAGGAASLAVAGIEGAGGNNGGGDGAAGGGTNSDGNGGGSSGGGSGYAAQLPPPSNYANTGSPIGAGPGSPSSGAYPSSNSAAASGTGGNPLSFSQGIGMSMSPDSSGIVNANSYNGAFTDSPGGGWDRAGTQSMNLANDPTSPVGGGGSNLKAAALLPGDQPSASMASTGTPLGSMSNFDVGGGYQTFGGGGMQQNMSVGTPQMSPAAELNQAEALLLKDKQGLAAQEVSDEVALAAQANVETETIETDANSAAQKNDKTD